VGTALQALWHIAFAILLCKCWNYWCYTLALS